MFLSMNKIIRERLGSFRDLKEFVFLKRLFFFQNNRLLEKNNRFKKLHSFFAELTIYLNNYFWKKQSFLMNKQFYWMNTFTERMILLIDRSLRKKIEEKNGNFKNKQIIFWEI